MKELGQTRSSYQRDHLLHTPDAFVRTTLPGFEKAVVIIHTSPAMGAAFTQYSVEFENGGRLGTAKGQRFVYVLDGKLTVTSGREKFTLEKNGYAFVPAGHEAEISAKRTSRAAVIEKPYVEQANMAPPPFFVSSEHEQKDQHPTNDEGLIMRQLLPDHPSFDFAVNTMTYVPGAALPMVEIHVMEHGLLMLSGGGIYRLGDRWYAVNQGDFIWMAPYCPQWYGALGKVNGKYLIYKDANRHPL